MQGFINFIRSSFDDDVTSSCENSKNSLQRIRSTYPPKEEKITALCINLKA